jgi:hypothetical protein
MAILIVSPLANDRGGWEKEAEWYQKMGHSFHLITKNFFC